jgi:hypothetical protein
MTNEDRDPLLQSLFAEAEQELDGGVLTAQVMARTRSFRLTLLAGSASALLLLLAGVRLVFGVPLFDFAMLISEVFATPLVNLGDGWLGLLLLPVNTIASLLVILFKTLRVIQKKVAGASFGAH